MCNISLGVAFQSVDEENVGNACINDLPEKWPPDSSMAVYRRGVFVPHLLTEI
jgi:hypothetical protein